MLDTESATLGTDISSEYVHELPLANRSFFGLTFLAAGVTEVAGSGTSDNYPSGTNFTSNGQRNATAEVRLDGALISAPEQGEGGNSNVYYEPLVEGMQEMKVQNNSFSAEFGNNGGTVVNMVMKSGTDEFHGSGWYFLQRAQLNARDFFNPGSTVVVPNQAGQQARPGWLFARRPDHQEPHILFRRFREGSKFQRVQRSCDRTDPGGAARRLLGGQGLLFTIRSSLWFVCPPPATPGTMCRPTVQRRRA